MLSVVTVAQLSQFDDIIDVRTPAEFAEDHIPGATNFPVLNNEERVRVGTLYKQSPFEAKKLGAALISANIARHLESDWFRARPKRWRPLVCCWRGGQRSGSLAHILSEIGWPTAKLEGGYKAYRQLVLAELETLPAQFSWRVICGPTGSGKSRLLEALAGIGAQVLDLEALAAHRGSILGNLPDTPQPGQKAFDSGVWHALRGFTPEQPVYVEAESRKIGVLRVPDSLLAAMWQGQCIRIEAGIPARVELLKEDYRHFLEDPQRICQKLGLLVSLHGQEVIGAWQAMARDGRWDELVAELLKKHYDPAYGKSTVKHYPNYPEGLRLCPADLGRDALLDMARRLVAGA